MRPISIRELTIESTAAVKYLGLMLDSKMSFFEQIKAAAGRTVVGDSALGRVMTNIGGSVSIGRLPFMGATQSVLLCGAEVWADALDRQLYADTRELSPDNIFRGMLKSASSWNRLAQYVRVLLIARKAELD